MDDIVLPENIADLSADELDALEARARAAFDDLYGANSEAPDEDTVQRLGGLRDVIVGARAERDRRAADQQRLAGLVADIASDVRPAEADAGTVPDPAAEAELGDGDDAGAGGEPPAAVDNLAASARPSVGSAARRTARPKPPAKPRNTAASLVAAAGVPGFEVGAPLDFDDLARAALARYSKLPTTGPRVVAGFGAIRRTYPENLVASGGNDEEVLEYAGNETRLTGGSLLAAGGWCAPSETWYDLCPGLETRAGLLDLPTVNANRGGVRWTQGPQFCDFYSGSGFFSQTEAEAIAGMEKPCFEIPCPDFDECRLDAHGLCLTAGILQNRGYPEYVRRFIEGSLVAHAHRVNAVKIQQIVAAAVVVAPGPVGPGATASVLGALELQIEDMRYLYRMDPDATLEVVLPYWLRGIIRSDLAKRNGVDMLDVTNAQINDLFASRGARVQWVYDWQDALCGTADAGGGTLGGATPATVWPATVQALVYPAGTFVVAEQDVITLDAVYSPELFRVNKYNALFTEEAFCLVNRCNQARALTIPICANGATGPQLDPGCPVV